MSSCQVIQPTPQSQVASQGQQQSRGQSTSFLAVDEKQTRPSRPLTFTLTPTKHFNPLSVASATDEESQHNISGRSCFFGNVPLVLSYQQIDTSQPFSPADTQVPATLPPTTTLQQQYQQPSLHLLCSQPTPNSSPSRTSAKPSIGPFDDHCSKPFQGPFLDHPNLPKTINKLLF